MIRVKLEFRSGFFESEGQFESIQPPNFLLVVLTLASLTKREPETGRVVWMSPQCAQIYPENSSRGPGPAQRRLPIQPWNYPAFSNSNIPLALHHTRLHVGIGIKFGSRATRTGVELNLRALLPASHSPPPPSQIQTHLNSDSVNLSLGSSRVPSRVEQACHTARSQREEERGRNAAKDAEKWRWFRLD
ncbi:hypothetical protein B0H16DRAFT_1484863 [Mycena metata]|uniref:Uncharacterized protein n=1 Tax=Mycena metata TaxID=1033252 RepID=A0AAD7DQ64_9AGAR|nr:hypothetical protein B0H16DRAFT_1484863 [Mycena metata]